MLARSLRMRLDRVLSRSLDSYARAAFWLCIIHASTSVVTARVPERYSAHTLPRYYATRFCHLHTLPIASLSTRFGFSTGLITKCYRLPQCSASATQHILTPDPSSTLG